MKKGFLCAFALVAVVGMAADSAAQTVQQSDLFPPDAKPGECYTRVFVPATYETVTENVLKSEASSRLEIVPARFETAEETVLMKEASTRLEVVPAEYEWVEETVLVKPAAKKIVEVPARYETVSEQVVDTPAHVVWKEGRGPIEKVDNSTGEIMCLVEVPATYKTVTKRVLAAAATTEEVEIPAEYKTVRKQVLKTPATTREVEIPAEYGTVTVTKMVSEPRVEKIDIPAEYQSVTHRKKVTEGRMAWREVLCETNTTPDIIARVQTALRTAGYSPGASDGKLGTATMSAIRSFQMDKGLPTGGLTLETLEALGL